MERGLSLRQVYDSPGITLQASVQDALTAKLAELAGFRAIFLGGAPVTNALLGMPDCGFLTLDEMAFVAARAAAATEIPVMVDADNGYGNAINVVRSVRTLERAGAGGILIEDQQHPSRGGFLGESVISPAEMVGKVKAAVDSRRNDSLVVIARTDSRPSEGIEAAIARGQQYVEAGADGLFATGLVSVEETQRMVNEVPARYHFAVLLSFPQSPDLGIKELQDMGFSVVTTGSSPIHAGALATLRYYEKALGGVDVNAEFLQEAEGTPLKEWFKFTGFDWVSELERHYLPSTL